MNKAGQRTSRWLSYWLRRRRWSAQHIDFTSNIYTTFSIHLIHHIVITLNDNHCVTVDNVGSTALFSNMISQTHKDMQIITYRWSAKCTVTYTYYQHNFTCQTWCLFYYITGCHKTISAILKYRELITYTYYLIWKKLVPWGTDGRLPLSGDFRSFNRVWHSVEHHSPTFAYIVILCW